MPGVPVKVIKRPVEILQCCSGTLLGHFSPVLPVLCFQEAVIDVMMILWHVLKSHMDWAAWSELDQHQSQHFLSRNTSLRLIGDTLLTCQGDWTSFTGASGGCYMSIQMSYKTCGASFSTLGFDNAHHEPRTSSHLR